MGKDYDLYMSAVFVDEKKGVSRGDALSPADGTPKNDHTVNPAAILLSMERSDLPKGSGSHWTGSIRHINLSVKEALDLFDIADEVRKIPGGPDLLNLFGGIIIQGASIDFSDRAGTTNDVLALQLDVVLEGLAVGLKLTKTGVGTWQPGLVIGGLTFDPSSIPATAGGGLYASITKKQIEDALGAGHELHLGTLFSFLPPEFADIRMPIPQKIVLVKQRPPKITPTGHPSAKKETIRFLVGIEANVSLNLSDHLPLIGSKFPANEQIGLKNVHLLYASAPFPQKTINALRGISDLKNALSIDGGQLLGGLNFSGLMGFGDIDLPLFLPLPERPPNPLKHRSRQQPPTGKAPAVSPPNARAKTKGGVKWFKVNKKLGPVQLNRVGMQYQKGELWLNFDVAFTVGGLTLSLEGLAIGFNVKSILKLDFGTLWPPGLRLRGLGLDVKEGSAVEIAGALLRDTIKVNGHDQDQYAGAVLIKTEALTITAIGAYSELGGAPSLFVYAFLGMPLGGPAFFFVTGLAAGFGYNRKLLSPNINQIAQFPLVQMAMGSSSPVTPGGQQSVGAQLLNIVSQLQDYIPPALGEIFLAVGIRFTTFKLINSFALLVLSFGQEFQIRLLGLTKLVAPLVEGGSPVTPIAEVQIGLIGTFYPDKGMLKIDGSVQPGSYLISRDCHLSGGFAFYSWFKGEHEGDFVFTVGGYHPKFAVPDHYPRVPRLAFSWQVDSHVIIKGDAYFALTSTAIMAGGHLDALFTMGHLRAWFHFAADFLISWQPYHYDIAMAVSIGISYTFHICIKIPFIGRVCLNKTLTLSKGVGLHVWGPDFAGTAHVSWYIISFDVPFGSSNKPDPKPISWPKFKTAFLPHDDDKYLTAGIKSGLLDTKDSGEPSERWVISPKAAEFVVDTVAPLTELTVGGKTGLDNRTGHLNRVYWYGNKNILLPAPFDMTDVQQDTKQKTLVAVERFMKQHDMLDQTAVEDQISLLQKKLSPLLSKGTDKQLIKMGRFANLPASQMASTTVVKQSLLALSDKAQLMGAVSAMADADEIYQALIDQLVDKIEAETKTNQLEIAQFGVGPMLNGKGEINSVLEVDIKYDGNTDNENFEVSPILKLIPAGLWGEMGKELKPKLNAKSIPNGLSGVTIRPKSAPIAGHTNDLKAENLQFDEFDFASPFSLNSVPAESPASADDFFALLKEAIPAVTGQNLPKRGLDKNNADFLEAPREVSLL